MNARRKIFARSMRKLKPDPALGKTATAGKTSPPASAIEREPQSDVIVAADCIEFLNQRPPQWIDLVFADPPFNNGYLYDGYDDRKKADDYLQFSRDWMKAVHRALAPTGSFYLAIGDEFAADLCVIARRELGFTMRNWIIWHYTFGQQPTNKFARSHTHILYFTKDEKKFTFNGDAVRIPSARQMIYADSRANPKGKLPDDVWFLRPQEAPEPFFAPECDTWNVSRVCGTFKEREGWHGCQMPVGVLNRIIAVSSNPGDMVVDPFSGSGTTAVAAALQGRQYVGIDQSEKYVAFARARVEHALAQSASAQADPADLMNRINDPARNSRVCTIADALGRPRVIRPRSKRLAS